MRVLMLMCVCWMPIPVTGYTLIGQDFSSQDESINNEELAHRFLASSVTFQPGNFSKRAQSSDGNVYLNNGLSARPIAESGKYVTLSGREVHSSIRFHADPDGAAVFRKSNGGWYYVSNAEQKTTGTSWVDGGVGALEFTSNGRLVNYTRLPVRTRNNCGGGATPWNSWVTCEEIESGKVWQVDPSGKHIATKTALGTLGMYESFAYDDSTTVPTFYVTQDSENGVLTRFTPNSRGMDCYRQSADLDRWCTLNHGTVDFLLISGGKSGTFHWTTNLRAARSNAEKYYPNAEGIDVADGILFFTSKELKRLTILDLKRKTYTYSSTVGGAFQAQPDQVTRLVPGKDSILYFCEDGGLSPGVHGRSSNGRYFTILEGIFDDDEETTGLAFSPDGMHMYVTFQSVGIVYDVTRNDMRPFQGALLDIKYHKT